MDLNTCVTNLQQDMITCLQENIRIPSVRGAAEPGAPYGSHVRRCLDHALAAATKLGFRTGNMDGHIGWCEYGEGEEMIAVLGHLDVVPAGDGWSCDPWGAEIIDGRVMGRGTTDDKGPTIAALYALAALRDSGLPIRRRIRLLFGCNEETGSNDMKHYLANGGEIPVMGFTPDAEYPVINGEKGIINATFSRKLNQTGDLRIRSISGGTAPNVVPAAAEARLSCPPELAAALAKLHAPKVTFTATEDGVLVEAEGISAHGACPEEGENAIGRLLLTLDTLPFEGDTAKTIHFLATFLGMETDGKSAGIALRDDVSGGLSLNLGVMKADEETLSLTVNYRYPVTKSYADCAPGFNAAFRLTGFTLDNEMHKDNLYIPEDIEPVTTLLRVYREQTGLEGTPKSIGGGTYAKALPNTLAFGPIFPGDEVREHKADEFMRTDRMVKNAQIIAHAMYAMAK